MSWLRRHTVAIAIVLIAAALGVAAGSGFIGNHFGSSNSERRKNDQLTDQVKDLKTQLRQRDDFIGVLGGRALAGSFKGRSVLVITTPEASAADVAAVSDRIAETGAKVTGRLQLTDALLTDQQSAKLDTIVDQSIPPGAALRTELTDSGGRLGDLLGLLLQTPQAPQAARDAALQTLQQGGFVAYSGPTVEPAQFAVMVTGGRYADDSGARGQVAARFAAGLAGRSAGTVLAGRTGSADGGSPVAVARRDLAATPHLSTVDDVDQLPGQITVPLALVAESTGTTGDYGTGAGASAPAPR